MSDSPQLQRGSTADPRKPSKFVAVDRSIMRGAEHLATALTPSWARRIALALNRYKHEVPNWK